MGPGRQYCRITLWIRASSHPPPHTQTRTHIHICTQQMRKICSDICLKELMYSVCIYVSFMCIGTYMYSKLLLVYFNLYQHALFDIFFFNSELLNGIRIGLKNRISWQRRRRKLKKKRYLQVVFYSFPWGKKDAFSI